MNEDVKALATALSNCRYAPATSAKRFARMLGSAVENNIELSDKQIKYMYQLACSKRNQIGSVMFHLVPQEIWQEYRKQHRSIK